MAVSLSSEEEARRSFVANVSHELKTPMTTISGFVDGILDGTIPPEKHAHYLQIVSGEVKRLSRLVRSMLDLSRIDSGQLKLHPVSFDFTQAVCASLLSFEQQIEQKQLTVEGLEDCEPQTVCGDFDLLQQVVYNLLENAVKFTNEGGTLSVRLYRETGRTFLSIRNTGEGIPSTELPHIFERFYKSDRSRSLDKSGTGLGLYLVKTIVNLHGGEITVQSVPHEYCEFVFWLPDCR
jgi:signal transduction histidine kinase